MATPGRPGEAGEAARPGGTPEEASQVAALVLPVYRAVDIFVDQGSKHFAPGAAAGPALSDRLLAWLEHWQVIHVVADASGVGRGLVSWLQAALGEWRVTGYDFSTRGAKAALGSAFLALVETGRFQYWAVEAEPGGGDPALPAGHAGERPGGGVAIPLEQGMGVPESASLSEPAPLSDAWWFWRQVEACAYELPPDGVLERDLRWGVPDQHRTDTPAGRQPTHDDRLISAALIAELDRLVRAGKVALGRAESSVIPATDPLGGDVY